MVVFPAFGFRLHFGLVETSIEVRYVGVVVGRATVAGEIDENNLFLPVPDPLPVGTKVSLKLDDRAVEGRVTGVSESSDPSKCGMRIQIAGAAGSVAVPATAVAPAALPLAEMPAEGSGALSDGAGDSVPSAEDGGVNPGATGGRRKKRRR